MVDYTDPQIMEAVTELRDFLRKINKGEVGQIHGGDRLYNKIAITLMKGQGFNNYFIAKAFRWLKDRGEIQAKKWNPDPFYPAEGMVKLKLKPLPLKAYERDWNKVVSESLFSDQEKEFLQQAAIAAKFSDLPINEMAKLLKQLHSFRMDPPPPGQHLYDVSAQYFSASSKVLDYIGPRILKKIGIDSSIYLPPPKYICVAGRPNPRSVILVENPHSFETAVRVDRDLIHTWVSSYGFGLSLDKSKEYGQMLVNNLKEHSDHLIHLTHNGQPESIEKLLSHPQLHFWGDLDKAGMQIYSDLRQSFPQIQLSALYQPMIEHLRSGNAHTYSKASGKEKQKTSNSDDPLVSGILSLCKTLAVDQEVIGEEQIATYMNEPPLTKENL